MRTTVALLLTLAACSGKDPVDTDPPTTDDGPDDDTAHTAEPEPDLTGNAGSVVLVHTAANAYYPDEYTAVGLFTDDDFGPIQNLATCGLFIGGGCVEEYPAVGAPGVETFRVGIPTNATHNVGDLSIGDVLIGPDTSNGFPLYYQTITSLGGPGGVSFDGDFAPYEGTADYVVPDEIGLTSPDVSALIDALPGGTIDLVWTAPGAGAVYLEVLSFSEPLAADTVIQLDDDGSHTVNLDELQFRPPFETKALVLSRIENSEVDASGNTLRIQTRSDQWIYVNYENTVGWTELVETTVMAETCEEALLLPSIGAGQFYGDLAELADDHDLLDYNSVTGFATAGREGVVPVTLTAGQTLSAVYRQDLDAAIYVLDSTCDVDAALDGADSTYDGAEEELDFTAPEDGTYYLVLDTWTPGQGGPFTLVVEIQ